jgi:hypothetical protein
MKYSVEWTASARSSLAELWLSASNRNEIQKAADEIDRILAHDPLNAGESRVSNIRVIFQPPLAAYFDVHSKGMRVKVWRVWRLRGD